MTAAADARAMAKALHYIADGRVHVMAVIRGAKSGLSVDALVRGSATDPYAVALLAGRWTCNCPARSLCAHIVAVALVTDPTGEATGPEPVDDGYLRHVPTDVFSAFPAGGGL